MTKLFEQEEKIIEWLNARADVILNPDSNLDDKIVNTWLILDGYLRKEIINRVVNKLCESGRKKREALEKN